MKKEALSLILAICLISLASFVSADIIINKQPNDLYNLGEKIVLPLTVTTSEGIYDFLHVSLICDGKEQEFPKEQVDLAAGEAKKIEKSILLIKKFIGDLRGNCRIKAYFEDSPTKYVFSDEFRISNTINISLDAFGNEFNPGESIVVKGSAKKENNEDVNGFLEVTLVMGNESDSEKYYETVSNGFFSLEFSTPKDLKAGQYLVRISVYEKDPLGEVSNNGLTNYNVLIRQVPTSLEIVFENKDVDPGTDLKVKTILHDQTGEKIDSIAITTIKNSNNKIIEQKEVNTDEFLAFPIAYNEMPSNWTVVSVSNRITSTSVFEINQIEDATVNIINKTVIVTNRGNVPYNNTLLVKIGNSSTNINVYLKVDETKKYTITAPDGAYDIEVVSHGEVKATGNVILTGSAIDVKEISASNIVRSSAIWIFLILVLGFMVFMVFRKGYRKSFFGRMPFIGKAGEGKAKEEAVPTAIADFSDEGNSETITNPKNKAELSLSLNGEKQNASIICLGLKNFHELSKKDESTGRLFDRISDIVVGNKGFIYESQGYLFFLLIPSITKTFRNERRAVEISQAIEKNILNHNRMFKQKVNFGISVNYGDIITRKEKESLKFMAFGNLMNISKKIASLANSEIYLSDALGKRILSEIKADKLNVQGTEVYKVKELKEKKEEHQKFIRQFMKRLESSEGDRKQK